MQNRKKADWILNGGIEEEWDSYLEKMEKYGLSDYLSIKQKYFDQYRESIKRGKVTKDVRTEQRL